MAIDWANVFKAHIFVELGDGVESAFLETANRRSDGHFVVIKDDDDLALGIGKMVNGF